MTQLALTSKKIFFFFTLHAKNASPLRLCLKSTLEILQIDPRARGFKKGPRRPTTSAFLSLSPPVLLRFPHPLRPRLLERRRKVSGTRDTCLISLSFRPSVLHYAHTSPPASFVPGRTSGIQMQKRNMGQGGGGRYIGGGREERDGDGGGGGGRKGGRRNKDRRLITTTSLNKHV